MRDLYYRRFLLVDQLDAENALVVDNSDVLYLQDLPELSRWLRDPALAASVEHDGGIHDG